MHPPFIGITRVVRLYITIVVPDMSIYFYDFNITVILCNEKVN